jgi:S1-C subfamily serine protease
LFIAGVLAALLAILLYNTLGPQTHALTLREVDQSVAQALASATPPPPFSARVYQVIRPSLVLIQTSASGTDSHAEDRLGSGVVVDDSGDILTSLHVVAQGGDILVTFADGTQSSAEIAVKQPSNDIAVLRATTPPAQLVPATLGNPGSLHVGDDAYAVGNPFGLYSSMTAGVISGFNRTFDPVNGNQKLQGLIQIDAAVNPGNSGGPLLNRDGEVVGIIEGIVNPTGQDVFVGIGFAVPISVAVSAVGSPPY